ncbi:putative transcriptional regulator [Calothrix sp. NIES-4071]|nr:putative transcriptional regulator [Calothrix sp. NIES-4071]BAZ63364.1 putative transcriptional regulator [Calothrix sp. NIES-4105]
MNTKPFSELRNQMTPEQREMSKARALLMSLHISLIELQESMGIPQENLEKELGIDLANISNIEHLDDIQISSLSRYIQALGGSLKIVADFPGKEVVLAKS